MNVYKKILATIFLGLLVGAFSIAQAQIQDEEKAIDGLEERLAEKEISEDEITKRLKDKGVNVDELSARDLPVLENMIQSIINEIEQERQDSADLGMFDEDGEIIEAPEEKGIEEKIEKNVQFVVDQKIQESSSYDAENILNRMKKGLSLEEAISEYYSEKLMNQFSISTEVWGHDIFFNKSLSVFNTVSSSTTPDSYILDAGDQLAVNIFGISQTDLVYTIDEDGFIRPERGTKIYVKGLTLTDAKKLIEKRFAQFYMFSKGQFKVSLVTARTIKVTILGEINRSGSYTLSALNSAINAIMAAGGPKPSGSIREIQILSNGKKRILDIYEYMYHPEKADPIYLHDNDIIFIPPHGKIVEAGGEGFKHQAKYELKEGENFNDLVQYAGGLKYSAYLDLVNHEFFNESKREIRSYSYSEASSNELELRDGDIIYINEKEEVAKNFVQVLGGTLINDQFQWTDGMRFSDAMKLAIPQEYTYMEFAYLKRQNEDETYQIIILSPKKAMNNQAGANDPLLKPRDIITFFTKSDFQNEYFVAIDGAVKNPLRVEYSAGESVRLSDMMNIAQGLKPDAANFGYVISNPVDKKTNAVYRIFSIEEILNNRDSENNYVLQPQDSIYVPSNDEFIDYFNVEITGAIRKEGPYAYDESLTLRELIILAGGFKVGAAYNRIDIFRLDISQENKTRTLAMTVTMDQNFNPLDTTGSIQLRPFDQIAVRSAPEFEMMKFVTIEGEVKYPGRYAILRDNEKLSDIITRAGGLTEEAFPEGGSLHRIKGDVGYVVTSMERVLVNYNSKYNIVVRDSDRIEIPKIIDIVFVNYEGTNAEELYKTENLDTTNKVISTNFQPRRANWYINNYAAGFKKGAKRSSTTVRESNGRIRKTKNFVFFRIYPRVTKGATVKVDMKPGYIRRQKRKNKEVEDNSRAKGESFENATKLVTLLTGIAGITSSAVTSIAILNQTK